MVGWSNVLGTLLPKHVHLLPAVFFQSHLEERWCMDVHTIGEELNANNDK